MAQRTRKFARLEDFTGGLNLRADQFQLAPNESPEMVDVDIDPRGGLKVRRGVAPLPSSLGPEFIWEAPFVLDANNPNGPAPVAPTQLFAFTNSTGVQQIISRNGEGMRYGTGGDFLAMGATVNANAVVSCRNFNDLFYIQDGVSQARRWDGSTLTTLGTAWANSIAAPTGGNMPIAKHLTSHLGRVWVAHTTESATTYRNRIRWSHPNRGEDFRQSDFIDVDIGVDGDEITALVPFRGHLLVFKRRSLYAVYGSSEDDFRVVLLSATTGCPDHRAIAMSETQVFWWAWPDGVYAYNGEGIAYLFDRLRPCIRDGRSNPSNGHVALGYAEGRLYVGVPFGTAPTRTTFVYDETASRNGSWTRHSLEMTSFLHRRLADGTTQSLVTLRSRLRVYRCNVETQASDDFGAGPVPIPAVYRTAWIDGEMAPANKKFGRPWIVGNSNNSVPMTVQAYKNFDGVNYDANRLLNFTLVDSASGSGTWGSGTWGSGTWGLAQAVYEVESLLSIGTCKSVQLRFAAPSSVAADWAINSIVIPYTPKTVK